MKHRTYEHVIGKYESEGYQLLTSCHEANWVKMYKVIPERQTFSLLHWDITNDEIRSLNVDFDSVKALMGEIEKLT